MKVARLERRYLGETSDGFKIFLFASFIFNEVQ
jgi:hypothetical protein